MATITKLHRDTETVYQARVRRDGHRPGRGHPATARRQRDHHQGRHPKPTPVAPQAMSLLQARRDETRQGEVTALRDDGLVFPSRVTRSKPVALRTLWETALKRAGIEGFKWHDLRHSAASFLAKGGASLLEIGAVLGHKSANTTKRYAHLTEQHTHDLVRGMAERLLGG